MRSRVRSGRPARWYALSSSAVFCSVAVVASLLVTVATSATPAAAADPPVQIEFQQSIPTPGMTLRWPGGADFGDTNGDGRKDALLYGLMPSYAISLQLALGNGDGSFAAPTTVADISVAPGFPGGGWVYWGGDAWFANAMGSPALDIVASSSSNPHISVYEGNGDGTFKAPIQVPATLFGGNGPPGIRPYNLNGDGVDDIVTWSGNQLVVYLSTGPGAWAAQPMLTMTDGSYTDSWLSGIEVFDVDSDTDGDLVAAGNSLWVWKNDGAGGLTQMPRQFNPTNAWNRFGIQFGDYDHDGDVDFTTHDTYKMEIWVNDGTGVFTPPATPTVELPGSEWRYQDGPAPDVDGDGNLDMVLNRRDTSVSVLFGAGNNTFTLKEWTYGDGAEGLSHHDNVPSAVSVFDANGDGLNDIVVPAGGERGGSLSTIVADPAHPRDFKAPRAYRDLDERSSVDGVRAVVLEDWNGDGSNDLVYQYNFGVHNGPLGMRYRPNDGTGRFGDPVNIGTLGGCSLGSQLGSADFDLDGKPDVLCMGGVESVGFNDGAGLITGGTSVSINTGGFGGVGRGFDIADFNADGHPDVVNYVSNNCCPYGEPWVGGLVVNLYNTAQPRTFVVADPNGVPLGSGTNGPGTVSAGDFDNDGVQDLLATKTSGTDRIRFFKGHGDGTFDPAVDSQSGLPNLNQIEAADVNGDGNLDLVANMLSDPHGVDVFLGQGDGQFGPPANYQVDTYSGSFVRDDFNGDGTADFAGTGWQSGITTMEGRTDGTYASPRSTDGNYFRQSFINSGELTGDNKIDLVTGGYGYSIIVLDNVGLLATETKPNLRPTSVTAPAAVEAGQKGDIAYTVKNEGKSIVGGSWIDRVYLSRDSTWDPIDPVFFSVARSGDLAQGDSYTQTVNAPFVPEVEGPAKVIVRSELFDSIDELNEGDNLLVMPGTVNIDVPVLAPGAPQNLTLADGQLLFRRILAPQPDQVLNAGLAVDGSAGLFVRNGKLPTSTAHDFESPGLADPQIVMPGGNQARYVLLKGNGAAGPGSGATLDLHNLGFEILSLSPDAGSNQGQGTTLIKGGGFVPGSTVTIANNGDTRDATGVLVTGSTQIEATFDLTGLPVGDYDLTVTRPDASSVTRPDGYHVNGDPPGRLEVLLSTPGRMRTNWIANASVTVHNTGGTDLGIPVVLLDSSGGAVFRSDGQDTFINGPIAIVPRVAGGPQTRIPPHASVEVNVPFLPSTQTLALLQAGGSVPVDFTARLQQASSHDPLDFASRFTPYRPLGLSDASWADVLAYIGGGSPPGTWGAYVDLLTRAEAEARLLGMRLATEAQLLGFLVDKGLVFAPNARVTGKVRTLDGTPAAGGTVRLTGGPEPYSSPIWPDGSYAVRDAVPGSYRAEVDGFVQNWIPPVLLNGSTFSLDITVEKGEIIKGFVTRASDGAGVADTEVTVKDPATGKQSVTRSEPSGYYQIGGNRVGEVPVSVAKDGFMPFGPAPVTVTDGADAVLHPTLTVGGNITGTVRLPGGAPAAGANVMAQSDTSVHMAQAVTTADGTYTIPLVVPGNHTVTAWTPGSGRVTSPGVAVTDGATTSGVDFQLTAPATATGFVRDGDGAPIAGAHVDAALPGGGDPAASTGPDGSYTLTDLPAGPVDLIAWADTYTSQQVEPTMVAGSPTVQDFALTKLGTIGGVVQNTAGQPLADVPVTVVDSMGLPFTAKTGPDGRFSVSELAYGDYRVVVFGGVSSVPASLSAIAPTADVDIELDLGSVQGRVVDGSGTPMAKVPVTLLRSGVEGSPVTRVTGADGNYRFDVANPGTFEVIASSWAFGLASSGPISVPLGAPTNVADLAPSSSSLDVVVTGPTPGTDPLAGAAVSVMREDLAGFAGQPLALLGTTDAAGHAVFNNLAPGTYRVEVMGPSVASKRSQVVVGGASTSHGVAVDPGQFLGRTVLKPGGSLPQPDALVAVRERGTGLVFAGKTDPNGIWKIAGLPAGTYDGWVTAPGAKAFRLEGLSPQTTPGSTGTDTLESPDTSLSGRVSRGGNPQVLARIDLVDAADIPIATTFTDQNGNYSLTMVPPGVPVNLRITHAGASAMALAGYEPFAVGLNTPMGTSTGAPAGASTGMRPMGAPAVDQFRDVIGPPPAIPMPENPFETMDPLQLAESWLRQVWRDVERDPRDDGRLEARLGSFDPNWCAALQQAWINADRAKDLKNQAFENLKETQQQLFWRTLNELGLAATQATILMGKIYVAVGGMAAIAPAMEAQIFLLAPAGQQLAGPLAMFIAGAVVDLASVFGSVVGYLIDGGFDAVGNAANIGTQLLSQIAEVAQDLIDQGVNLGFRASLLGLASNLISMAFDVKGLFDQMGVILGTIRDVLERVAQTKDLYRHAFEQFTGLVDEFSRVRAAGCRCPNGQLMPPDGKCDPPPPPNPPPPPPPDDPEDPDNPNDSEDDSRTDYVNSRDPNSIDGPAGDGPARYVTKEHDLGYIIHFENSPQASAPAQRVVVTQTLDGDVDLETFELGDIGFGSTRLDVPPGLRSYETTQALPGGPYLLKVAAELDVDTRTVTWTFTTIDPATGDLPTDPDVGFLPPNVTSPQGEGVLEYSAKVKPDTPVGATVPAQASIVFDENPAILTNTWINTIGVVMPPASGGYHPLVPARILDTRDGTGGPKVKLGPKEKRTVKVTGVGGVPEGYAAAVALNVTAVGASRASHLSVWSAGEAQPTVSNLNFKAEQTVPNFVMVKVGDGGSVDLFNNEGSVDVLFDVSGWFDLGGGSPVAGAPAGVAAAVPEVGLGSAYVPLVPSRIVDTRDGTGGLQQKLGPGETRTIKVTDRGGVPVDGVKAVIMNVTAVGPSSYSHLSLWPAGESQPTVSNLNFVPGQTVPNLVIAQVGADGNLSLFNNQGTVDVLFDVAGYFVDPALAAVSSGAYHPLVPERILDTRYGIGGPTQKLAQGETRAVVVAGVAGVPASGVKAVVVNVTAVGPSGPSHLSLWPSDQNQPTVSNLNFVTGQTVPNLAVVQVGADGKVKLFNNQGTVDVIFDISGYVEG